MLRMWTRSLQKDQQMGSLALSNSGSETYRQPDCPSYNHKTSSFFNVPGLFIGLIPKGLSDCDSVRSPTSPLEFRIFSSLGNPCRSPYSTNAACQKSWDCSKVGLSIVESLDDVKKSDKILRSSESKTVLFGSGVRIKTPNFPGHKNSFEAPKSLPRNFAVSPHTRTKSPLQKGSSDVPFEIGDAPFSIEPFGKIRSCSLDSCRSFSTLFHLADRKSKLNSVKFNPDNVAKVDDTSQMFRGSLDSNNLLNTNLTLTSMSNGSCTGVLSTLSASEMELSEDYTCVTVHGPNPKKTHIFGNCILEQHTTNDSSNSFKNEGNESVLPLAASCFATRNLFPSSDFLSFCYYCNKKLEDGKDIYIYRGEKAFCSLNCRSQEIMIDELLEKSTNIPSEDAPMSEYGGQIFETGIMDAL